jgi:hypothetical protein
LIRELFVKNQGFYKLNKVEYFILSTSIMIVVADEGEKTKAEKYILTSDCGYNAMEDKGDGK